MVLVSHSDGSAPSLDTELRSAIRIYWEEAKPATDEYARRYRDIWQQMQPALDRLSGRYGSKKARVPPIESSVMSMNWAQFLEAVREHGTKKVAERIGLLRMVRSALNDQPHFSEMDTGLRRTIAGLPTATLPPLHDGDWAWFGSMKGAGYFQQAVNQNNDHLSFALDMIPLNGLVSRSQYLSYVTGFKKAFSHGGHGVAPASRLLALKRPDQFICLDSKNRRELCKDFEIPPSGMTYQRYWDEVIERLIGTPWWNSPRPTNDDEAHIWDGRAAMLDAIFYRP